MQRPVFEAKFYETYHFASVISDILSDQFGYLRSLDEFYGDDNHLSLASPFPQYSALHSFIEFVVEQLLIVDVDLKKRQEMVKQYSSIPEALIPHPSHLPINEALDYYGISHTPFADWLAERSSNFGDATDDDVDEYCRDLQLEGPFQGLLEIVVGEVFHVIFQNRRLLLIFNDMIARQVGATQLGTAPEEFRPYFVRDGVLRRVAIPKWVQKAVYFRDRGICVLCSCDLSGSLSIGNVENYDHIVPLSRGGLNDVTNIQLLCRRCNLEKHDSEARTSDIYEAWYKPLTNV